MNERNEQRLNAATQQHFPAIQRALNSVFDGFIGMDIVGYDICVDDTGTTITPTLVSVPRLGWAQPPFEQIKWNVTQAHLDGDNVDCSDVVSEVGLSDAIQAVASEIAKVRAKAYMDAVNTNMYAEEVSSEGQQTHYVIRNSSDQYWNNDFGWVVNAELCTKFPGTFFHLPIDGRWEEFN